MGSKLTEIVTPETRAKVREMLQDAKASKRFIGSFDSTMEIYGRSKLATEVMVLGLGKKKNYARVCLRKALASS
jgi:hypothetical protein